MEENQKIEDSLSLALTLSEEERKEAMALNAGFLQGEKRWELIVKSSKDIQGLQTDRITIEPLDYNYYIVTLPAELIEDFADREEIEYIEMPKRLMPQLRTALEKSCFGLNPGVDELSGEGVFIGIIDSGIDLKNPIFLDENRKTKVRYLYDQDESREYSAEEINDALLANTELPFDRSGHGSRVAAIASKVAPKSELLIVKLNIENQDSFPHTTNLMRAIKWLKDKALKFHRPLAVNISYGNTYGSHDGDSLLERYIDATAQDIIGNICIGSGNEASREGHFEGHIWQTGDVQMAELAVGAYERSLSVQLWSYAMDSFEITILTPGQKRYTQSFDAKTVRMNQVNLGRNILFIYSGTAKPYTTKAEFFIEFLPLDSYLESGIWEFQIKGTEVKNGTFHMYLPSYGFRMQTTRFLNPGPLRTVTIPATAKRAICVGAYDSTDSSYADFSGRGSLGGDSIWQLDKPDLAAPGVDLLLPPEFGYQRVSGTSYATPMVTGATALLLEWGPVKGNDPYLYGEKLKAALLKGARKLPFQTRLPDSLSGWGALCLRNALRNGNAY